MNAMISNQRLNELMQLTIDEAWKSEAEDGRAHPKVGAILANSKGEVVYAAHRTKGRHAEYNLLEYVKTSGISTRDHILFTTLEPCTHRGVDKIPCAERVAAAGLASVYIGVLDPNPLITGRGETFLSYVDNLEVERFPAILARQIRSQSKIFFDQYRHMHHEGAYSLYAGGAGRYTGYLGNTRLLEERNGVLQQTLDLISGTNGPIDILAGDLSWLSEAQATLLSATLDGRSIRLLARPSNKLDNSDFQSSLSAAAALGIQVGVRQEDSDILGTCLPSPVEQASVIFIDMGAATLFRCPEDSRLIKLLLREFAREVNSVPLAIARQPVIGEVKIEDLIETLISEVPQYKNAAIGIKRVPLEQLLPMTNYLERYKLFRVNQIAALRARHPVPALAKIAGTPWPIIAFPIAERLEDGRLVIIDGTHRSFSAVSRGEEQIDVLVVEGVTAKLPGNPMESWDEVRSYTRWRPRHERYINYSESDFRPISRAYNKVVLSTR